MLQRRPLQRRSFLKLFSLSLIAAPLAGCSHKKFFNADEDILLSGGSFDDSGAMQNALLAINLTQQETRVIETPFLPHGIIIDPDNKYRVFCFEKNANNACEIDLQTQKLLQHFQLDDRHIFSGHAAFSHDGKSIYSIETDADNSQGSITIRDSKTFNASKTLPTLGLQPHDCKLTRDNILLVSNTGTSQSGFHQPSLVYIDMTTEKLVERVKLEETNLNCGHFQLSEKNDLVVASAPSSAEDPALPGGVSIKKQNETISTMTEPAMLITRLHGEALGVDINEKYNVAAVTHPDANLITFWSLKDKSLVKAFTIEAPRGICQTLDRQHFIISYGNRPSMVKVSTADLSLQADSIVQATHASGEHVINWSSSLSKIMPKRVDD